MIFNLCIIFITIRTQGDARWSQRYPKSGRQVPGPFGMVGDEVELELWEPDLEVDALVEVRDELEPEILQELLMPEDEEDEESIL